MLKITYFFIPERLVFVLSRAITFFVVLNAIVGQAAEISMIANDSGSTSSFSMGSNWNGGLAPTSGNTYFTAGRNLQTPVNNDTSTSNHIFAGDVLTINGGYLIWKSLGRITIPSLIIDGGTIANWRGNTSGRIYGHMTINTGKTLVLSADEPDPRSFQIYSDITGTGSISVRLNQTNTLKQTYFYGNNSNFIGRIELRGRGSFGIVNETGLGANPAMYTTNQFSFNGATLIITNNLALTACNRGIMLNNTYDSINSLPSHKGKMSTRTP